MKEKPRYSTLRQFGCVMLLAVVAFFVLPIIVPPMLRTNRPVEGFPVAAQPSVQATATRRATITATPIPATEVIETEVPPTRRPAPKLKFKGNDGLVEKAFYGVEGVLDVDKVIVLKQPGVYAEITVEFGYGDESTAAALQQAASKALKVKMLNSFSVIIYDGVVAADYVWNVDEWQVTELSVTPLPKSVSRKVVEMDATQPPTRRATLTPRPTRTRQPTVVRQSVAPAVSCPRTCATAIARGMSAQEAGQCRNLDRDKDGVACYGD
jgi:hypothetical protein